MQGKQGEAVASMFQIHERTESSEANEKGAGRSL